MDPAFLVFLLFAAYAWFAIMNRLTQIAKLLIEVIRELRRP